MSMKKTLKQVFAEEQCVLAPEVYDCVSVMAAEWDAITLTFHK